MTAKFEDYQYINDVPNNKKHLVSSDGNCSVTGEGGKLFTRNAKTVGLADGETVRHARWVVMELNGVRVYFDGQNVVMTTEDIYP